MTLSITDEQTLANSGIDWAVVGNYTIIVVVVVAAALVSWAVVSYLFKDKTNGSLSTK